jgi:histidine triad (HIT) family protein
MSHCKFCEILSGETPSSIVYQDELCTAFMDIQSVNPGHVLVIPDAHAPFLADLDEEAGAQMFRVAQRIAQAAIEELGCQV